MGRRSALGMADREPGGAEPGSRYQFETARDEREHDQHKQEVALIAVEDIRSRHLQELGLARKGVGGEDRIEGAGEAERDDREIDAAQTQRRQADGDAERHSREAADQDPHRQAARHARNVEPADRPGAHAGERELAKRDHAGATLDDAEAEQIDSR